MLKVKRAYEAPDKADGRRFLVDRLWPRGVRKEALEIEAWLKEVSPSDALRKDFHGHPDKWEQFRKHYFKELDARPEAWRPLVDAARKSTVTLLYAAKDPDHNNAVALSEYLKDRV